jgi:hypothetical protein
MMDPQTYVCSCRPSQQMLLQQSKQRMKTSLRTSIQMQQQMMDPQSCMCPCRPSQLMSLQHLRRGKQSRPRGRTRMQQQGMKLRIQKQDQQKQKRMVQPMVRSRKGGTSGGAQILQQVCPIGMLWRVGAAMFHYYAGLQVRDICGCSAHGQSQSTGHDVETFAP